MGLMVACETLEDFDKRFENILYRFRDSFSLPGTPSTPSVPLPSVNEDIPQDDIDDPRHIINVALKFYEKIETDAVPQSLLKFVAKWVSITLLWSYMVFLLTVNVI
jgi:hypothetical protein